MSMRAVNQNNVFAGSFVIGGILLAVIISFVLGDIGGKFGKKTDYVVRFPTNVGVMGLQTGADVTFAGMTVGQVVSVEMHLETDEAAGVSFPGAMDVHIKMNSDLVLYENAIADLSPPILGGISKINIASAGTGAAEWSADAGGILNEGEMLQGRFAPSILKQIGFTAEETQKILDMIDKFPMWSDNVTATTENVAETTERISRMAAKLEPNFNSSVDDGRATIGSVRTFSEKLNGEDGWSSKVDSIVDDAKDAASKLSPTIDEAKAAVATTREIIDENRGKIGRITDNVERITEKANIETIEKLNTLLADGALAMGTANETLDNVKGLVDENRPNINATMVNVRQISLKGKLMVDELRAQPWRVLKTPSKDVLKREPLYVAARLYAGAVGELRIASESLDTAVRMQGGTDVGGGDDFAAELLRLASVVQQAYGRYEQAERGLLDLLSESP